MCPMYRHTVELVVLAAVRPDVFSSPRRGEICSPGINAWMLTLSETWMPPPADKTRDCLKLGACLRKR